MKYNNRRSLILILFFVLPISLLVACGGGGGGDSGNTSLDPPSQESGLDVLVETEDGLNIGVIKGETSAHRVLIIKDDENISADVTIVTPNRWIELVEIDGLPFLSINASQDWNSIASPVTVIATNRDNRLSAQTDIVVTLLDSELVASGRLDSSGGVVQTNGGAFGVRISEGELLMSLGVEIWAALSASGQTHLRIKFDRDVSNETARMSLVSNLSALASSYGVASTGNGELVPSLSVADTSWSTKTLQSEITTSSGGYPLTSVVQSSPGWFIDTNGTRIANQDLPIKNMLLSSCSDPGSTTQPTYLCVTYDPNAAILSTMESPPGVFGGSMVSNPVLFIPGYKLGGALSGGAGSWGEFPALVTQLRGGDGEAHIPYEFRWRTNAAFNIVAGDLADAITKIHGIHGKPVRIIAHSMGGLLIRTLVQGLADRHPDFQPAYIDSILSLGTPHSGIFDEITTVDAVVFPNGQDMPSLNSCGQMSCRQAGVTVSFDTTILSLANAGETGGLVASLSKKTFPDSIPMVVGIGLKRDGGPDSYSTRYYFGGDGLITFEGQRYKPSLDRESLRSCENHVGERVSEVVLGAFNAEGEYDLEAKPGSEVLSDAFGYAHSAPGGSSKNRPNKKIERSQAYISCESAVSCGHASLALFAAMTDFPEEFCDAPRAGPVATLAGSRVTVTLHYPVAESISTVPYETVVDSGIEIPAGLIQEIETYANRLIPVDIDIGARTIDLQFRASSIADNTSSNGYVFDFEPDAPMIIGASLDASSTYTASMVAVTFGPRRVKVNFPGIRVNNSDRILVNVEFAVGG